MNAICGISPEMHLEVTMLFEEYGRLLDEDRLEDWTALFMPDCLYEIISRENVEQNLPLSLMLCDSRDMLDDRVYSLREANVFNIHYDCHIIGPVRVTAQDGAWTATAAYSLFQSIQAGETRLFSVGRYHAELKRVDGVLRIAKMRVLVDTGAILTLLATPI
ncbi:aromatic-ring-hydroxylating dioxygenase subunit beta [Komagataeibacter intermedius]|uniref:Aromatic-ring-hydroxylating dioxygenase n=2 Tax=Komagataeibacter intermedius TaxID=66229 RepID=A0A0N1FCH2_9PROT|nr:aromatic-ring-hydroxylating dioxygenase subunit beta [Komagataeibacter intermedius]KPH87399.1 aromatic-ring-hydroxylating dioxygenase [Komagataeibacter intermedius AF2]MCF3636488.1 aromatic-ring-hydroxylating dioxygenase subunit beta [Komagataeibacter intermedius]GAN85525.1 aromatic oxygenase small subunit [Komagataeibacter intermedius TF2]GBQ65771.1 aromatic oxygenase small subunit [Komagataeibacter intermedius NRIC 0521]